MISAYTIDQYQNAKSKDLLPLICKQCTNTFLKTKRRIKDALNPNLVEQYDFCSKICQHKAKVRKTIVICLTCKQEFLKLPNQIKKSKNHFCSQSCSATYNNRNKTHGTRRSKLESWLETQLTILYPTLHIDFNKKDAIGSELDICIPALKLAFELNGIFHYEPIYGNDTLFKIQNNDISKTKACHDAKIDLCIIDTSEQKKFKISTSQKYLDIIINIINQRTLLIT